jgi:hypothetical protein
MAKEIDCVTSSIEKYSTLKTTARYPYYWFLFSGFYYPNCNKTKPES